MTVHPSSRIGYETYVAANWHELLDEENGADTYEKDARTLGRLAVAEASHLHPQSIISSFTSVLRSRLGGLS